MLSSTAASARTRAIRAVAPASLRSALAAQPSWQRSLSSSLRTFDSHRGNEPPSPPKQQQQQQQAAAPSSTQPASSPPSSTPTPSKPITKPVQMSYAPNKGGAGGGSITFSLPPNLLTALKSQSTTSAKSSKSKLSASARAAREEAAAVAAGAPAPTGPSPSATAEAPDAPEAIAYVTSAQAGFAHLPRRHTSDVFAWATAYQYDFNALVRSGRLPPGWTWVEKDEVIHVPSWPSHSDASLSSSADSQGSAPTGEVFILRSGSYITWNLPREHSQRFLRQVIQGRDLKHVVEKARYNEMGDETMECLVDPAETTRIRDGVIVLGKRAPLLPPSGGAESGEEVWSSTTSSSPSAGAEASGAAEMADDECPPLLAKLAFSQGLATSARLSVQETALSHFLSSVSTIPTQLESTGRVPLTREQVIRQMGTLLRLRQKANLDRDNFYDEPEVYWDNARMEEHFRSICAELDISSRFETLNDKLDHGENLLGVVRALLTESTAHRMEVIIIALIAFEAGIALLSHGWIPEWVVDAWEAISGAVTGRGTEVADQVEAAATTTKRRQAPSWSPLAS